MTRARICALAAAVPLLACHAARVTTTLSGDAWTADGEPATVPHTWNAVDGADGFGDTRQVPSSADTYERKRVRYRRALPGAKPGRRYFVRCEGASIRAVVRVNGTFVGEHVGAFTAFVFDATDAMKPDANELEIEVDNHVDRDVPPISADFTVYGGLYRDVQLVETDELRFDSTPDGGPGVVVEADPRTGRVVVAPRIAGAKKPEVECRVEGPGLAAPVVARGCELVVPSPRIWSPETPAVYTLTVTAREGGMEDSVSLPFGFRTVEFRDDGLFYLNGKARKIRGVNYHQDREGKGWAVSAADQDEDLKLIKDMGADGVRTAHYPHSPHVYDTCDRLGLLAWLEMPNVNVMRTNAAYRAHAFRLAREVVAQHRHHPSVFVWSLSNEVKLLGGEAENAAATELQRELDAFVRKADPSRPTALATFKPLQVAFNAIPDAVGFNFYPGWYRSSAERMGETIDEALAPNPGLKAIAVSEYGAGSTPGQHEVPNLRSGVHTDFHSEEYAAFVHHLNYKTLAADPRIWGSFVWVMFDFGSDTRHEGGRYGLNDKGLVGFDHRTLKEPYWFYKANWSKAPVLHLVGERMEVTTNAVATVMAFSNVGDATLTVNGRRVGTVSPDETMTATWDGVALAEGENEIAVEAGGRRATAKWRLAHPVTLHVSPAGSDVSGDGSAEKPFATPTRARDELRSLKSAGRLAAGGTVVMADGEYRLSAPFELDARDSGTARFPTRWRAANRSKAVLTGAGGLKWAKVAADDPVYDILPEPARAKVVCATMPGSAPIPGFRNGGCLSSAAQKKLVETPLAFFQGGSRLVCARWPDDGWTKMGRQHGTNVVKRGTHEFMHKDGIFEFGDRARLARWAREPDLWAHGLWYFQWADTHEKVLGVDVEKGLVRVDTVLEEWGFKEGNDFYVLNAFSELDRPGEWAVDRARRRVYAWPLEGSAAPIDFAATTNLVVAKGLEHAAFDGLVFEMAYKDALSFRKSSDVSLVASVVRHTGGWAVRFDGGLRDRVDGCDVYDVGEGGIYLEGGNPETLEPARHVAVNDHVHHYGRVIPNYRPGISLNGVGCRAERNLVHHSDHQGLQFNGNDHYVGYNVFHDLCQHNDDAGVVYGYMCDFTKRGTVVEYNVIHMSGNQPRANHVDAIYLDAWTSGVTVRGNVINRAPTGIWSSGGQANVLEGNLIMNCVVPIARGHLGKGAGAVRHVWSKGRNSSLLAKLAANRARYERPPWRGRYPMMLAPLAMDDAEFAHSALWATITNNAFIGCGRMTCSAWDKTKAYTALGGNRVFDDDPFCGYYDFDWNLRPGSPLRGFLGANYRFSRAGLFESANRVSPPVKFSPDATRPRPLVGEFSDPAVRIDLTFEGALPQGVADMAADFEDCTLPHWGHGKRIVTSFGDAPVDGWRDYSFSFTPTCDGRITLWLMGGKGEMTLYKDVRADGASVVDGDFPPGTRKWGKVRDGDNDPLLVGGVNRKYGIADGGGFAAANHDLRVLQPNVAVKKGVRVKISFRARANRP